MKNNSSNGVSIQEVIEYLIAHIKAVIVWIVIIAVLSFIGLYIKNTSIVSQQESTIQKEPEQYRKEEIDKLADLYVEFWDTGYNDQSVPAAERVSAGYEAEMIRRYLTEDELEYFNRKIGAEEVATPAGEDSSGRSLISMIILAVGFGAVVTIGVSMFMCVLSQNSKNA